MLKILIQFFLIVLFVPQALALEKIVLQLKWEHEFQFAGYYAAKWQGFYAEAGFDVEIRPAVRPDGVIVSPIGTIEKANADYAIGALDILIGLDRGSEIIILASIFQRSPNAIFSLSDVPIDDLTQLSKLRIAVADDSSLRAEVIALFKTRGFDIDQLRFVDEPVTVETLLAGKADAISTYQISARRQGKEKGVELNELYPRNFGINFFSDTLFTSKAKIQSDPVGVKKFVDATKRGWEYALTHKKEIARRISDELPRHLIRYDDFYGYNLQFSEEIDSLMNYPEVPIGKIVTEQWITVNEQLRLIGVVRSQLNASQVFYKDFSLPRNDENNLLKLGIVLGLLLGVFFFWYRRKLKLTLSCLALMVLLLESMFDASIKEQQVQASKLDLTRRLNSVSAKLKGNLQANLSMLTGFSAYISARPDLSESDFRNYAKEIFKKETLLINFAAAKDLVVNFVYPQQGSEKVIGLDYLAHPQQRDMVLQVVNSGQLMIAGPIDLIQGGRAFIGRAPIFVGDGTQRKSWGIISAPLDLDLLYSYSGVTQLSKDYQLAIKTYDSFDDHGKLIFGSEDVFIHPTDIQEVITVGGGTWRLAVAPLNDAGGSSQTLLITRGVFFVLFLLISTFIIFRFKQEKERNALEQILSQNEKLLVSVGKVAKIGGWKINANLDFEMWSGQAASLIGKPTGYIPASFRDFQQLISETDGILWEDSLRAAFEQKLAFEIEVSLQGNDGEQEWRRIIADPANSEQGYLNGTIQDVTAKIKDANVIQHQATYDALTDLPNRTLFNDRLTHAIQNARRYQNKIAVLFIDLDRFKPVNDNYGHQIGDKLLIEAANRILPCVRDSDTVSRLSGDEFGVVLVNIADNQKAIIIVEKILRAMKETYIIDEISIHCSASIGIAFYPDDADDSETLMRNADQAMYVVKSSGRNGWQFYTEAMQISAEYRHNLLNKLINAVNNNELDAYYQPILDMTLGKTIKVEALCRWRQKDGSFIAPDEFIPIAEESGLINRIDIAMLKLAAKTLIELNKTKGTQIGLSINVSPRLFHAKDDALKSWLENVISLSQFVDITVEITERLLTDDTQVALDVLLQLKKLEVKIAIDDFGTGYSSLSYLIKFPVDIIKIDKSFVDSIGKEKSSETLIETIIVMAKKLGIAVIAEGIENQIQVDYLAQNNCDFGQGYLLAKPMSNIDFNQFIELHR